MNNTFYIAHPIDQRGDWQFGPTKAKIREALDRHGVWSYWPQGAWTGGAGAGGDVLTAIGHVNRIASDACSAMIAVLPDGVPTLGTPSEIERAIGAGKPVGLICGKAVAETVQVLDWCVRGAEVMTGIWGIDELIRDLRMKPQGGSSSALKFATLDDALEKVRQLPTRAYAGDAGFDLYVSEDRKVHIGEYVHIPTNVAAEFPVGTWGLLHSRSSTMARGLLVNTAVIDGGYRGELFVGVKNIGESVVDVRKGERIAQLIPMPQLARDLEPVFVDQLGPSDRGSAGWGSSGR